MVMPTDPLYNQGMTNWMSEDIHWECSFCKELVTHPHLCTMIPEQNTTGGYYCNACGKWIKDGDWHICGGLNRQEKEQMSLAINDETEMLREILDELRKIREILEACQAIDSDRESDLF